MYKELIISICIVVIVVILDYMTQKYTDQTILETTNRLGEIRELITNGDDDNMISQKADETYDKWIEYHNKLAFYIEHDELEKVETNFIACKSFIQFKQYDSAVSELDKTVYVLDHISDKYSFNLVNIF